MTAIVDSNATKIKDRQITLFFFILPFSFFLGRTSHLLDSRVDQFIPRCRYIYCVFGLISLARRYYQQAFRDGEASDMRPARNQVLGLRAQYVIGPAFFVSVEREAGLYRHMYSQGGN